MSDTFRIERAQARASRFIAEMIAISSDGIALIALLVKAGFAKSNGEARRLIAGGGVRLHDTKIDDPTRQVTADDVTEGYLLVRAGKKRLFRFDITGN